MKYKLIIFDIDGTITKHISSWRYIHEKLGLWDVLAKKYQDMFLAGKISYRKFCELDAAHWKGMEASKLYAIFQKVKYSKNAKKVIKKLKNEHFKIAAVSTGLQFLAERLKKDLGFDYIAGNRLNVRNGKLTGGVRINIGFGEKGRIVKQIMRHFGVTKAQTIAVGDSEGDIPMLRSAGYGIAFNSTRPELSKIADHDCGTTDFMEIYDKISEIMAGKGI